MLNERWSDFESGSEISEDLLLKTLPDSQELRVLDAVDGLEVGQFVGALAFLLELRESKDLVGP